MIKKSLSNSCIFLAQTDTIAGFLSYNKCKLSLLKKRNKHKSFLQICKSFKELKTHTRVPSKFKKRVRHSRQTTFIYPNKKAFRVVHNKRHLRFLENTTTNDSIFSTSANLSNMNFDKDFALNNADIIIYQNIEFNQHKSSNMFKINKSILKIR